MKAILFYGPRDLRYEETERPAVNSDEVLVKVKAALTCGTDVKTYRRGHPVMYKNIPALFGHEMSGIIEEVGKNVGDYKPGMRVVSLDVSPCNGCFYCYKNRREMCENSISLTGAYAEYVKVPGLIVKQSLWEIPKDLPFEHAALVEPLSCVVHGMEIIPIEVGETVVINGVGPIGLMFVQLAKLRGARVIACDLSERRLEMASKLGADETVNPEEVQNQVMAVRDLTPEGRGADVAIEAAGFPEVWEKTISMVRKAGTALLFGGCESGTKITLDTKLLHYSELTIKGVFASTPSHARVALDLIIGGQIDANSLITHRLPLSKGEEGLKMVENKEALKVALLPDEM